MVKRSKSKGGLKSKGGSSRSSRSSLLRELESKYSKTSLPSTASGDKLLKEVDPSSKRKNDASSGLGLGLSVALGLVLVIVGLKFAKV